MNLLIEVMQLKRLRGCIITCLQPLLVCWSYGSSQDYIIQLGVGWLALLILEKGQCESLIAGIGTEKDAFTPFSFPHINYFNQPR